jgi:hypothetical protein
MTTWRFETRIASSIDRTHPAFTEGGQDFAGAEAGAGCEGQR